MIFQTTAEAVSAAVGGRREELVKQPAVTAMNDHAIKAAVLAGLCAIDKVGNSGGDVLLCHSDNLRAVACAGIAHQEKMAYLKISDSDGRKQFGYLCLIVELQYFH